MGGFGSGRWGWHRKATAVEDGRALDLAAVTRGRAVAPGLTGVVTWSRGGERIGAVGYAVAGRPGGGLALELSYRWTPGHPPDAAAREVRLAVPLDRVRMPRGGSKWVGRCPLAVNGVPCGRPVAKLYLPPGHHLFGCRRCHRLAYRGSQEHDRRVSALMRDPAALAALVRCPAGLPVPQLGRALAALMELRRRDERDAARAAERAAERAARRRAKRRDANGRE